MYMCGYASAHQIQRAPPTASVSERACVCVAGQIDFSTAIKDPWKQAFLNSSCQKKSLSMEAMIQN
jgi:hypothetical protein